MVDKFGGTSNEVAMINVRVQPQSLTGGLKEESSDLNWNETYDLPAYSIVPHATKKA